MSDYKTESDLPQPGTTKEKNLGHLGVSAMQGYQESQKDNLEFKETSNRIDIKASEFTPETRAALKEQGLDDPDSVLSDNSGKTAEETTKIVFKHEGIPISEDQRQPLKDIISGQYDEQGHGIDLIGITPEGKPIVIENKKRRNPKQDSMGNDSVPLENMEPETLALKEDILREREVNPAKKMAKEGIPENAPDQDLSNEQMGGLWTRDRWLKLVKSEDHRQRLRNAGVNEEYLDLNNLNIADSPKWQDILDERTTVVVSTDKDYVTGTLKDQALFTRGCNVVGINLKE